MIYYMFLLMLTFYLGIIFLRDKKKQLFTISVVLAFFSGFRHYVGVDYINYVNIFDGVLGYNSREIGFGLFIELLHYIGGTYQLMFLILACVFQCFVYKVIEYYSVNYWLSLIIFILIPPFFLASFNGTRQYIAIAIFLYSLRFLDSRNYYKYFITCIIGAVFFHQSILFVMLLFPFIKRKLMVKTKIILFGGMLILNLGLNFFINYTSYSHYLFLESDAEISNITYLFFFVNLFIIILGEKFNDFKFKTVLLNINFFSFLCLCMVMLQSNEMMIQMFMRLNNYFFFGFFLLVPNLIYSFKGSSIKFISSLSVAAISSVYFFYTIINNGQVYNLTPFIFNFKLF